MDSTPKRLIKPISRVSRELLHSWAHYMAPVISERNLREGGVRVSAYDLVEWLAFQVFQDQVLERNRPQLPTGDLKTDMFYNMMAELDTEQQKLYEAILKLDAEVAAANQIGAGI